MSDTAATEDAPQLSSSPALPLEAGLHAAPPALRGRRRRPVAWIITVAVLSLALTIATAAGVWLFWQLEQAAATVREQDRELEEQRKLIDRKDTFGAAMDDLIGETASYAGIPLATVVPWDHYQSLVDQAWSRRWVATQLDESIAAVQQAHADLVAQRETAAAEASVNASGSIYEQVFDELGSGFVTWQLDDADALCDADVLACVSSDQPRVVHIDAPDDSLPYMNDEIRTGIAYHEFAHVLQFTNPAPTDAALSAFGGDSEAMADCFALTYLDGWKLDQRVWVSGSTYWDVSIGYGYTCDSSQRQAIREWRDGLGIQPRQLGPGAPA